MSAATHKRPVPLEHSLFYGSKLYPICKNDKFTMEGLHSARADLEKKNKLAPTEAQGTLCLTLQSHVTTDCFSFQPIWHFVQGEVEGAEVLLPDQEAETEAGIVLGAVEIVSKWAVVVAGVEGNGQMSTEACFSC